LYDFLKFQGVDFENEESYLNLNILKGLEQLLIRGELEESGIFAAGGGIDDIIAGYAVEHLAALHK
jgi:hypothetical protein